MRWSGLAWPLAALPSPLGFAWAQIEVGHYEGWGQWAAAPLLLVPLGYGALIGTAAAVSAAFAWRSRRPPTAPLIAATIALAPWFVLLVRNPG